MAKNKRTQQAQADNEEAKLGQNTTSLQGVTPKNKSANGGYGSGNTYITNNYGLGSNDGSGNGDANSNANGNTNGYGAGGARRSVAYELQKKADNVEKRIAKSRENVSKDNEEMAKSKNFDTDKGFTEKGYMDLGTAGHQVDLAERGVKEAEDANSLLQAAWNNKKELKGIRRNIKSALKQAQKAGYDPKNGSIEKLQENLAKVQEGIDYYDTVLNADEDTGRFADLPGFEKEYRKSLESQKNQLVKDGESIKKQIEAGENYNKTLQEAWKWADGLSDTLDVDVKDFEKWVAENPDKLNKHQLEAVQGISSKLKQFQEDGVIDPDEEKQLGEVIDNFGKLADETRLADENIQNADDKLRSAEARKKYLLFDQIKMWAVLLMGLSQGNAQMVYSALDQYNKKISDAESDYTANRIKAFSNNDVKATTGQADAQYDYEQIKPLIEKIVADKTLGTEDKAAAVEQLKNAFDTYRPYAKENPDFATWFTAQNAANANGSWGTLMQVLGGAALNADALREYLNGNGGSKNAPSVNRGGVNIRPGHSSINKEQAHSYGNSLLGNAIGSLLSSAKTQEAAKEQSKPINAARDKQALLASMKGQLSGAPQAGGTAAPVNKSWGA